jgi:hypothetical protein
LLKAIKEAEFDHEMGKLSKADADELVTMYRGRAIEVIKELDVMGEETAGEAGNGKGDVRARIAKEVKARLEVKGQKKAEKAEKGKERPAEGKKAETKETDSGSGTGSDSDSGSGSGSESEPVAAAVAKAEEPTASAPENAS